MNKKISPIVRLHTRLKARNLIIAAEARTPLRTIAHNLRLSYHHVHRYKRANLPTYEHAKRIIDVINRLCPLQHLVDEKLNMQHHNISINDAGDPLLLELASYYFIERMPKKPKPHKIVCYQRESIPLATIIANKLSVPLAMKTEEILSLWRRRFQRAKVLIVEAISNYTPLKTLIDLLHAGGGQIIACFFLVCLVQVKKLLPKVPIIHVIKIKNRNRLIRGF